MANAGSASGMVPPSATSAAVVWAVVTGMSMFSPDEVLMTVGPAIMTPDTSMRCSMSWP